MVPCSPLNIINFRPSPDTPMFTSHFTHIIKAKQNFGGPSLSLFLCWKLYKLGEPHCSYSSTTTENLIRASLLSTFVFNPLVLLRKMAYSKTFLLLGLVFAVVLLVSSEVSARKLLSWAKYMPLLFFFKPKCLFFLVLELVFLVYVKDTGSPTCIKCLQIPTCHGKFTKIA